MFFLLFNLILGEIPKGVIILNLILHEYKSGEINALSYVLSYRKIMTVEKREIFLKNVMICLFD